MMYQTAKYQAFNEFIYSIKIIKNKNVHVQNYNMDATWTFFTSYNRWYNSLLYCFLINVHVK